MRGMIEKMGWHVIMVVLLHVHGFKTKRKETRHKQNAKQWRSQDLRKGGAIYMTSIKIIS